MTSLLQLIAGIDRYVNQRIPVGGFLESVISNDLYASFARADLQSELHIEKVVRYLHDDCPADCWGSPDKYTAWLEGREPQ